MQEPGAGAKGEQTARDWQYYMEGGPSPEYAGEPTELGVEPPEVVKIPYPGGSDVQQLETSVQQGYGLTPGVPTGPIVPSGQGAPIGQVYPQWAGGGQAAGTGF